MTISGRVAYHAAAMSPFQGPAGNTLDKRTVSGVEGRMVDAFTRQAVDLVREIPATRLLDVGCGDGHLIRHIADQERSLEVVGIDADLPELTRSWERLGSARVSFQPADVYQLPFEDNSFQIVTAFELLEHVEDPHWALREMRRVCSGWLIASVPLEPWWCIGNLVRRRYVRQLGNTPGHIHHWSRHGFGRLLRPHGDLQYLKRTAMWTMARVGMSDRPDQQRISSRA